MINKRFKTIKVNRFIYHGITTCFDAFDKTACRCCYGDYRNIHALSSFLSLLQLFIHPLQALKSIKLNRENAVENFNRSIHLPLL
jgi:hypothetical protein